MTETLVRIENLSVSIASDHGVVQAVQSLSLALQRSETFALVGESGSGKSITALALLRLLPDAARLSASGLYLGSRNLLGLPERSLRDIRGGRIGIIFQEPATSLNPVMSVGEQIIEVLRRHTPLRGSALRARAIEWLARVGLPEPDQRIDDYPFQFSGGQKQRIMIALALAGEPDVLIADEPTTALDVTVQAQILELLADIQREMGLAILLITHDLAVVRQVADHVALMRAGRILEVRPADDFFSAPDHPYARQLLDALPTAARRGQRLSDIDQVFEQPADIRSEKTLETQSGTQPKPPVELRAEALPLERPERSDASRQTDQKHGSRLREQPKPVLSVKDLDVGYLKSRRFFWQPRQVIPVVRGVTFDLYPGETLALLGESGCGKTTVARSLLRLLDRQARVAGQVLLAGISVLDAGSARLRQLRRALQIVFQDPYASLNPRMPVGQVLEEGLVSLQPHLSPDQRKRRIQHLIDRVGLPASTVQRYAHEFSGGQRQRIAIARALAVEPHVLVCDEPTSALDVSVQAQILDLLSDLQKETNMAYLFITHNFGVVEYLADRVVIMSQGRIIEQGAAEQVLCRPAQAETQRLLLAVPRIY